MTANENMSRIVEWILAKHPEGTELDREADLIDTRMIDSLWFIEFILFIEEVTGHENILETASVDSFRTLVAIEKTFLLDTVQS